MNKKSNLDLKLTLDIWNLNSSYVKKICPETGAWGGGDFGCFILTPSLKEAVKKDIFLMAVPLKGVG